MRDTDHIRGVHRMVRVWSVRPAGDRLPATPHLPPTLSVPALQRDGTRAPVRTVLQAMAEVAGEIV